MTTNEAEKVIRENLESVDMLTAPERVKVWTGAARCALRDLDAKTADQVVSVIWEIGYVSGMEHAIYADNEKPFATEEAFFESAGAWHVLLDDFIKRAERGKYGLD